MAWGCSGLTLRPTATPITADHATRLNKGSFHQRAIDVCLATVAPRTPRAHRNPCSRSEPPPVISTSQKGTLSRAVKDGKLSARRLDNGSLAIDPSELQRYSDARANRSSNALEERSTTPDGDTIELRARLELAEQRLADLRELVHDLKIERDDWKTVAKRLALTSSQPQQQPAATPPVVVAVTPPAEPQPVRASKGMAAVHSPPTERRGWWRSRWLRTTG